MLGLGGVVANNDTGTTRATRRYSEAIATAEAAPTRRSRTHVSLPCGQARVRTVGRNDGSNVRLAAIFSVQSVGRGPETWSR